MECSPSLGVNLCYGCGRPRHIGVVDSPRFRLYCWPCARAGRWTDQSSLVFDAGLKGADHVAARDQYLTDVRDFSSGDQRGTAGR